MQQITELRADIARVRAAIEERLGIEPELSGDAFQLALADRILAAHEVIANLAEKGVHHGRNDTSMD